jgi:endoglucanase
MSTSRLCCVSCLGLVWFGCAGTTDSSDATSIGGDTDSDTDSDTVTDTGTGIEASTAAAGMGMGVNLGQMFESTQHPRTLAKARAKIDAYYSRGFRNIRIPITWTENVDGTTLVNDPDVGDVNRSHARLAVIEEVVDYALSKPDLYVVINAHHEVRLKTESQSSVLARLWTDISDIFKNRDHRLLYEILNEPHRGDADSSAMPPEDLRQMVGLAYAKIREIDPTRIVIIGGNQWFSSGEMATVWKNLDDVGGGSDHYLMATFHHYDPWTFCGDNQDTYDDPWTDSNISGPMDTMLTWANSVGNGMPVYIGEWGVGWGSRYDQMDCNNIRAWYTGMHTGFASARGIPTSVWDDGGWFKIFDHGSDSFNNNLIDCISGNCDWNGSERFNDACR